MKRMRHAIHLTAGLVLLAACGPLLADPALGDRRDSYRSQSDERPGEHRGWNRGSTRAESSDRKRADQRPLGTTRDDYRGRFHNDWSDRGGDRYRRQDDRYGHNARRAADAVRRDERGRVLSSEPTDDRGYRVRVLTPDGYVRERYVDPRDEHDDQRRRSERQRQRD